MLSTCGYRLLNTKHDDPEALTHGAHGLLVRGRGANHQADALGELSMPTPFSLPIRLFAEAKFRHRPTGLTDVRNALGVINDVNERYRHEPAIRKLPPKRYHYRYSLFSTSGFTKAAQSFALAQQISLIDLQGRTFDSLRSTVEATAAALLELADAYGITTNFPTGQVRTALRLALGTWQGTQQSDDQAIAHRSARPDEEALRADEVMIGRERNLLPREELATIAGQLEQDFTDVLILAFLDAPFVLALRPGDMDGFEAFLEHGDRVQRVHLAFDEDSDGIGDWIIASTED